MSLLIKNARINGKKQDLYVYQNRIQQICSTISKQADDVIDASQKALLPAFYNTHTHAAMVALRGLGEDKELNDWLTQDIWPREAKMTPELIYHATRLAILEMIKSGTVFFSDMYFYMPETIRAVDEMGVRAAISVVGMDLFDPRQTQEKKKQMRSFFETPVPTDRIIKTVACHGLYTVSEELFLFAINLMKEQKTFLHVHAAETKQETEDCSQRYGVSIVEQLNKWHALGPKTILAHAVHLSEKEREIIADTQTVIAHCPISNLKLNSGQMPLDDYLKKGIPVTLGTDGAASNNSLSMLGEMKIAALSAKNQANNIKAGRVSDIFRMATRSGATAFGLDAGEIREGALADFILVDLTNPLLMPQYDLIANLVYAADSSCITDVCCNGKMIMKEKNISQEKEIKKAFMEALEKSIP